jgi:hypothetical protein
VREAARAAQLLDVAGDAVAEVVAHGASLSFPPIYWQD